MPNAESPDEFDFNRTMGEGTEEFGVRVWHLLFPRIEDAERKLQGEYVQVVEDRSSLALDDRYLGRWRTGNLHTSAMSASLDSLLTVKSLLESNVLPMTALYPMLRSAIENAALAIYLLAPTERDERLRRSFFAAAEDAKYRAIFEESFGTPGGREKRDRAYADLRALVAARPSLGNPESFRFQMPTYTELIAHADAVITADPAAHHNHQMPLVSWWQLLSGLSHGKSWAMIEALERSEAIVDSENESAHLRMTSSAAAVALALLRAVETLEAALRLYGVRSSRAWAVPEDASEPPTSTYSALRQATRSAREENQD